VANWDNSFEDDFKVVDGWELVYLLRQESDGEYADPVGPILAARESVNKRTVAGQMQAANLVFGLDATGGTAPDGETELEEIGADGVRTGDRIRDAANVEYEVQNPTLEGAEDQWRCPVVRVPT
jgi:hypothetical protein